MKTILVLTDFGTNSEHAAEAAIHLAAQLDCRIILLNTFITVPLLPIDDASAWQAQDYLSVQKSSQNNLAKEVGRLRALLKKTGYAPDKPYIESQSLFGDLADTVTEIVKGKHVDLVIMGARNSSNYSFLFGGHINAIFKHIKCPVLIVPAINNLNKIKNIVFATDLKPDDIRVIKQLHKFAEKLKSQILACHISFPVVVADFNEEKKVDRFHDKLLATRLPKVSYKTLHGDNISVELEKYYNSAGANLLALIHKRHSIIWRIFNEKTCEELIKYQNIPLLIFPE